MFEHEVRNRKTIRGAMVQKIVSDLEDKRSSPKHIHSLEKKYNLCLIYLRLSFYAENLPIFCIFHRQLRCTISFYKLVFWNATRY